MQFITFFADNQSNGDDSRVETPNLKKKDKKHLRKSSNAKMCDADGNFFFKYSGFFMIFKNRLF